MRFVTLNNVGTQDALVLSHHTGLFAADRGGRGGYHWRSVCVRDRVSVVRSVTLPVGPRRTCRGLLTGRERAVGQPVPAPQHAHVRQVLDDGHRRGRAQHRPHGRHVERQVAFVRVHARHVVHAGGQYVQQVERLGARAGRALGPQRVPVEPPELVADPGRPAALAGRNRRAAQGHGELQQHLHEDHLERGRFGW